MRGTSSTMINAVGLAGYSSTASRRNPARVVSDRHLATGDPLPELTEGSALRLFSMRLSPYTQRVRMVLFAKGISYDEINCNLREKPEFLVQRNPIGKVPVLELNGNVITESNVICELLEELYPDPPLYPKDPYAKAKDRVIVEMYMEKAWKNMLPAMQSFGEDKKAVHKLTKALAEFEKELIARGTPYFGGQEPGMVDFMVWPFTERFMVMGGVYELVKPSLPGLVEYLQRMEATPAVQATINCKDHHHKFVVGIMTKTYVYDFPDSPEATPSKL